MRKYKIREGVGKYGRVRWRDSRTEEIRLSRKEKARSREYRVERKDWNYDKRKRGMRKE